MMGSGGERERENPEVSRDCRDENYATERNYGVRTGPSAAWGRGWSLLYVKDNLLGPRPKVALTQKCPVPSQFASAVIPHHFAFGPSDLI